MKSQSSLEYLFVASIAIAAIAPIFYYAVTYSSDSITFSQASDVVKTIANTADNVYSLGFGSTQRVLVFIPQNVINSTVKDNFISLKIRSSSGESDVVAITKANVTGTITTSSGYHFIQFNTTERGVVIS